MIKQNMLSLLEQEGLQYLKLDKLPVGQKSRKMFCFLFDHYVFLIFP